MQLGECGRSCAEHEKAGMTCLQSAIALASLKSGHLGTMFLGFQLAGIPACRHCLYLKKYCKCYNDYEENLNHD